MFSIKVTEVKKIKKNNKAKDRHSVIFVYKFQKCQKTKAVDDKTKNYIIKKLKKVYKF
jgi:hypothetical protein